MEELFARKRVLVHPTPVRSLLQEFDKPTPFAPDLRLTYRRLFQKLLRRLRKSPGAAIRGRRRRAVNNRQAGRNIRVIDYRPGENLFAPLPTVVRAVRDGGLRHARFPLPLRKRDLLGWDKVEHESLTLILLVDLSRSTHFHIKAFVEILQSLTGHFHRNRDRMGLISLQGRQARILNHPTHNYRVVTRNLSTLTVQGESPLADGLLKALTMARLERFRNAGSRSLVVMLSDCCPEPLTMQCPDLMDEPAYKSAMSAALLYRKEKVSLLVIQPSLREGREGRRPAPPCDRLAAVMAELSGGRLVRFHGEENTGIPKEKLATVIGEIEAVLQGGPRAGAERDHTGLTGVFGATTR